MKQTVSSSPGTLPQRLLYATSARIGGAAIAVGDRSAAIPDARVRSLRFHPVRLISFLDRPYYYGAKRRYADWIAARELRTDAYDFFHGWSGDALSALRVAESAGIPSVLDIPTWHCDHGFRTYENIPPPGGLSGRVLPRSWLDSLPIRPARLREEYARASLLLTRSTYATETFLREGFPAEKLCNTDDGADTARFQPGTPPPLFRALFVGALIRRKGVHLLLEAWHRLNLPDAELVLAGFVHEEMQPYLERFAGANVRIVGKTARVEDHYRAATVHVFPSLCEGCAKTTCEAAACGLPQITTREAGDVVIDGLNGLIIPCDDLDALCAALAHLHRHPELLAPMRIAARARAVEHFNWDGYRERLLAAYARALAL